MCPIGPSVRRVRSLRACSPIVAILLIATAGGLACAADENLFRFGKELRRVESRQEDFVAARLDADIYAATRDGVPDLRLIDASGAEVPYQLESAADRGETRVLRATRAEVRALRESDDSLELHVSLDREAPAADAIRFVTPLHDYERTVRVFGSEDGQNWRPLGDEALIFDYRRFLDLRETEVPLPPNSYREFKVVVTQATDQRESPYLELTKTLRDGREDQRVERTVLERRPFRIDRVEFLHATLTPNVGKLAEIAYPVVAQRVEVDAAHQRTIVHVTTRREPLRSLALQTTSRNFQRAATVQVPDPREPSRWIDVGHATLTQLDFRSVRREQLAVTFSEQRQVEYRLVIENLDSPPLEVAGVIARGPAYQAVFLAEPGQTYRALYGSESVDAPRYDTSAVLAAIRREAPLAEGTFGEERTNASFGGEPSLFARRVLGSWLFLGTAITVAVTVLAWSLVRAGRRLESMAP